MSQSFVKGRTTNNLTWMMVDATDFATAESALSAATKIKIYGKLRANDTVHFVSSGTGSLVNDIKHVGASVLGIYTIGLVKADLSDASAAWFDQYIISLSATGAAYQTLIVDGGIDASAISAYQSRLSDILSQVLLATSAASDAASAAVVGASRILLVQSRLSDLDSRLASEFSDLYSQVSDFRSDLHSFVSTTGVGLNPSTMSDLRSAITAGPAGAVTVSDISDIASAVKATLASDLSDILSAAVQANSRILVVQSMVSDVDSALTSRFSDLHSHISTTGVQLNPSTLSDLRSAITAGPAGAVTASDISDIASAVRAILVSDLSDILSAAVQANSRVLVVQSMVSDVDSALTSRFSDLHSHISTTGVQLNASTLSDLRSAITATVATVSASDISDIASAVRAILVSDLSDILSAATQTNSRVLVVQSMVSDTQSKLSDVESNLLSVLTATGVTLDASTMSDLRSAVLSLSAMLSDTHSAATVAASRALVVQSTASDIYSLLSDVSSDLGVMSGIQSDVYSAVDARMTTASAKTQLDAHAAGVLRVVIGAGSTATSIVLNATTGINGGVPSATNDFYNGAAIVFTSGTLSGQRTDITDYVGATVTLTVTALTGSPAAGDTAVIV